MASTFSTNLAIELIGTGDQAGTWGVTTNTNLGTLIEQAISGYVTQAVSTGADTTITIPNGATGVARNMYIELTGTGGTNTNLIVPSNKKLYFIFNNTSSGQVTVKVSGQTGVSVPNGKKVILVCNGTDVVNGLNYIADFGTNSFTVTNLTASSGTITNLIATTGTITTLSATSGNISNLVSSDASATVLRAGSATLTHLSATSASITNLALTSLTISSLSITNVSVASATVSSNLTLSGGTANGVLYLNGSKVATSGSALTFDGSKLGIQQQVNVAANAGVVSIANGLTLATGYGVSYLSSTDSSGSPKEIYQSAAFFSWIPSVGSEQMRLDSTGLGIGTSSPAQKLHISAASGAIFQQISSGTNQVYIGWDSSGGQGTVQTNAGLGFMTGATYTQKMWLDSSGNLGLGVTPSAWATLKGLQVLNANMAGLGNKAYFSANAFYNGSNWVYQATDFANLYVQQDGQHQWNIAPSGTAGNAITFTQAMTLDSSGNLGIGTSSPGQKLDVRGANSNNLSDLSTQVTSVIDTTAYAQNNGGGIGLGYVFNSGGGIIGRAAIIKAVKENATDGNYATSLVFANAANSANTTEKMRLDSSGNLGLGVTPSAWGSVWKAQQLQAGAFIASQTNANDIIHIGTNAFANTSNVWTYINTAAATRYQQYQGAHSWFYAASGTAGNAITFTQAMTLDASGNLGVGTSSPAYRLDVAGPAASPITLNLTSANSNCDITMAASGSSAVRIRNNVNDLQFHTNGSERARITSGGYFKASDNGTYAGSTSTYHEFYQSADNWGLLVSSVNASQTATSLEVRASRDTTNGSFNAIRYFNVGAGAAKFIVADSGNVTNTNNSYGAISDAKMKTDIVDAGSQWDDIKAVRFRKFKMKNDPAGLMQLGVVAQELEQTSPGLVDEHTDRDAEGNDLGTTTKSVKTSVLLMKAAVALQEAMARIEQLEAKVAALETK